MKKLDEVKNYINKRIQDSFEYIGQELYWAWFEAMNYDEKGNYVFDPENDHVKEVIEEISKVELMFDIWDETHRLSKEESKEAK